jgi:hypothetical protein
MHARGGAHYLLNRVFTLSRLRRDFRQIPFPRG